MMIDVAENVSEKRKRGRPSSFADWEKSFAKSAGLDVHTDRGLANICYQQRAIHVLLNDPKCLWLGVDEKAIMAGTMQMRRTIMQELGRIADDDELRQVAAKICELKPTARAAVAMLRQYRGRKAAAML